MRLWPRSRCGATPPAAIRCCRRATAAPARCRPYIRHGLLTLPRVWAYVEGGPARDVGKYRDELLWQEYARHLYARVGRAIHRPLRRPSRPR